VDMVYIYYHWIDSIYFVHILCLDSFFHISWSQAHSSVHSRFQILEQRVFVGFNNSFFSPRLHLQVKQSLKKEF